MLLFILFTNKIPIELDAACNGVMIVGVKITNLCYADDIVLVASSPEDLAQAILTLTQTIRQLRLTLNYDKSKILTMGPGTEKKHTWKVLSRDGTLHGQLAETNNNKYLGLTSRKTHYTQHLKLTTKLMKMMGAQTKAIARQSLDRPKAADVLWRLAAQPALLHEAEVVQYTKTWLKTSRSSPDECSQMVPRGTQIHKYHSDQRNLPMATHGGRVTLEEGMLLG